MKKSSFLALAVAPLILGAPMAAHAQSVTTDPVGFVKTSLPSGYSAIGINIVKPAEFSGTVTAVSGNTITLSAAPTLDTGTHYVEVADGTLEGDRVDIASVSGDVVTLNLAAAHNTLSVNAIEVGSRVIIREHYTFADITKALGDSLHTGENFPDSSDQILTWEGAFASHAVFDGVWYDAGGNPADTKVIAPGSGIMFYANPDAPARNLELTVLGEVRTNDFVLPLQSGYQFVATGFPTDESPASLLLNDGNLTGSEDPATADQIVVWNGAFSSNWMFTDGSWWDAGGNPVTDATLFPADGAALVYLNNPDEDFRVANRVTN